MMTWISSTLFLFSLFCAARAIPTSEAQAQLNDLSAIAAKNRAAIWSATHQPLPAPKIVLPTLAQECMRVCSPYTYTLEACHNDIECTCSTHSALSLQACFQCTLDVLGEEFVRESDPEVADIPGYELTILAPSRRPSHPHIPRLAYPEPPSDSFPISSDSSAETPTKRLAAREHLESLPSAGSESSQSWGRYQSGPPEFMLTFFGGMVVCALLACLGVMVGSNYGTYWG
ncbi:hypothetical protein SISSUDRAFT_719208 [Sistotremastrum suecicum HHB10207 ss-3]|uniref:Extracellular membrane protein CFEM domain-containing protein n=1 Tax=Sistotremastrum suecicum HHB10207 ss-3 TaxID=1314776 RepID=A0A166DN95_9AGAM|nr:hypothetical protein SISSUDRAFT_719208 [Sistotremastrum suecicum HHB10207 ss-3]